MIEAALEQPSRWKTPRRIFVNSQSDLFYEGVSDSDIHRIWEVMRSNTRHTFQVLTKRAERMRRWTEDWQHNRLPSSSPGRHHRMPAHIWLGVSCENQAAADARIPWLSWTGAPVQFLSVEPLLGPINLASVLEPGIRWTIVGGESGPGWRPMQLEWLEAIVEQCQAAHVAVFVKQSAGPFPGRQGDIPEHLWRLKEFPAGPMP